MNLWIGIAYLVLGAVAVCLLAWVFIDKIMRKEVGDDYMKEEHDEECEQVFEDFDAHAEGLFQVCPKWKSRLMLVLMWISWPVSVPIWMHKILKTTELEDTMKFF